MSSCFIGVDVGTSSVRAALFGQNGQIIQTATSEPLKINTPYPDYYEQSSDDIWEKCCSVVKAVSKGVPSCNIRGIGFDATCSLVVLGDRFLPVTVSPKSCSSDWNVIMWMDHRGVVQAKRINSTGHSVLQSVGGCMSVEMQPVKMLWLKEKMRESCWDVARHFLDLPDFLTWRATGKLSRSLCSLVCKFGYQASEVDSFGWDDSFLKAIGLEDLAENGYEKIGREVYKPGQSVGSGLNEVAARDLGLDVGTAVGTSLIDAHAGAIGCLSCNFSITSTPGDSAASAPPITARLALICGTSTCHMALSESALFVEGVWGPYYSVMLSGMWLSEGGQSAAGSLINHVVTSHPAYDNLLKLCAEDKEWALQSHEGGTSDATPSIHPYLNELAQRLARARGVENVSALTRDLHVWPDYHGNRSPLANPSLRGQVCGLSLSIDLDDLVIKYVATVQALAYGTRHIIDALKQAGHDLRVLCVCGGLSKNALYTQTHSDVTGMPAVIPHCKESVLLGSAMLGACAAGAFTTVQDAMKAMGGRGDMSHPDASTFGYHEKKYQVFLKMVQHQLEYRRIMNEI